MGSAGGKQGVEVRVDRMASRMTHQLGLHAAARWAGREPVLSCPRACHVTACHNESVTAQQCLAKSSYRHRDGRAEQWRPGDTASGVFSGSSRGQAVAGGVLHLPEDGTTRHK